MSKLAIVQRAPVFLDKEKTIALAVASIKEAAAEKAISWSSPKRLSLVIPPGFGV